MLTSQKSMLLHFILACAIKVLVNVVFKLLLALWLWWWCIMNRIHCRVSALWFCKQSIFHGSCLKGNETVTAKSKPTNSSSGQNSTRFCISRNSCYKQLLQNVKYLAKQGKLLHYPSTFYQSSLQHWLKGQKILQSNLNTLINNVNWKGVLKSKNLSFYDSFVTNWSIQRDNSCGFDGDFCKKVPGSTSLFCCNKRRGSDRGVDSEIRIRHLSRDFAIKFNGRKK